MLYCGPWSREAAGIYIGTARGNKENPSRTNRKGHGIARSNTRYVHNDISRDRGVTKLEADLGVRPQEVRCWGRSSNRQRGTSSRGAKAKAINSNDGALIVLATGIGTTLKIGKDSGRLRGSGQWNPDGDRDMDLLVPATVEQLTEERHAAARDAYLRDAATWRDAYAAEHGWKDPPKLP